MTRTYVDAGVLIAAATGRDPMLQRAALAVLGKAGRDFVSSAFVRLEVMPKAVYPRRAKEVAFYQTFFAAVAGWAEPVDPLIADAQAQAERSGLSALDALHVAAAIALNADELVTTERLGTPIHRVTGVKVVTIQPTTTPVS
jgi:predicted nucleic acid-binding protein